MVISRRGRRSICGTSWTYITAVPSNIPSAADVLGFRHVRESHDERTSYLQALGERLQNIEGEQPRTGDERKECADQACGSTQFAQ